MLDPGAPQRLVSEHHPDYSFLSSHPLCQQCMSMFSQARLDDPAREALPSGSENSLGAGSGKHYASGYDLMVSASAGCQMCVIIWSSLSIWQQEKFCREDLAGQLYWKIYGRRNSYRGWRLVFDVAGVEYGGGDLYLPIEFEDIQHPLTHDPGSDHTGSTASLEMVRDWLSTCVSSHPNCSSQSTNSGWLPSRLVDVGCGSAPSAPRLRLRDEIPPASPYLTLSHCWGASLTSKLTLSTLAQFRRAIPASALPRTYADAIAVARFLGVRHLWIDSLCIVQDSARDWAAECSTMGRVYAGALCSIAAAAARSGAGGCFASRHPTCLQPLVLETTTLRRAWPQALRRARWSVGAAAGADELVPHANAPLHARGWVLQERFLAARVVHFGRDRVFWECARGAAAEGDPAARPGRRLLFLPRWDAARGEAVGLAFDAFPYWDLLVDAYADTALTMEKDKLPAFSGIAKAMAPHLGFGAGSGVAYLAGLWSWRLAGQLLWSVPGGGTRVHGRAPSWSWASVEGQLYMSTGKLNAVRRSDGDYLFDILRCETFPVGEDEFQEVKGGCIRGTGWLWKIPDARKLLNGPDYLTPRFADGKGHTIPATFDEKNTERSVQFLLPIMCLEYDSIEGLILERCETLPGQFVRIGYFSAASQWMGGHSELQEALLQMLEYVEGFGLVRPDACDFEDRIKDQRFETGEAPLLGEYLYTITIV